MNQQASNSLKTGQKVWLTGAMLQTGVIARKSGFPGLEAYEDYLVTIDGCPEAAECPMVFIRSHIHTTRKEAVQACEDKAKYWQREATLLRQQKGKTPA